MHVYAHMHMRILEMECPFRFTKVSKLFLVDNLFFIVLIKPLGKALFVIVIILLIVIFNIGLLTSSCLVIVNNKLVLSKLTVNWATFPFLIP